jgi:hypothetical protein
MVEESPPTVPVANSIQRQKVGSYSLGPVRYVIPEAESKKIHLEFLTRIALPF